MTEFSFPSPRRRPFGIDQPAAETGRVRDPDAWPTTSPKRGISRPPSLDEPGQEVAESNYLKDTAIRAVTVAAAKGEHRDQAALAAPDDPTPARAGREPPRARRRRGGKHRQHRRVAVLRRSGPPRCSAKASRPHRRELEPGHSEVVEIEYTVHDQGVRDVHLQRSRIGRIAAVLQQDEGIHGGGAARESEDRARRRTPAFNGKPSTIEVAIENNGNAGAGPFLVEWKPGKGQTRETLQINELPEYAVTTVTFTNVFASAGTFEGLVMLTRRTRSKSSFDRKDCQNPPRDPRIDGGPHRHQHQHQHRQSGPRGACRQRSW